MTKIRLVYLFIALISLGIVFVLSDRGRNTGNRALVTVLSQGEIGEIARVKLENGEKTTEIALKDGSWIVPARDGYPADPGKVKAFLLRLLDLSLTQRVTSDSGKFDSLGVSDESVKKNAVRVTLSDGGGKELVGAILGDARKRGEGRYFRKIGSNDVFLVSNVSLPDLSPSYWLNSEVVNILPSQVKRVQHFLSQSESTNLEFDLQRQGTAGRVAVAGVEEGAVSSEKIDEVLGSYQAIQLVDVSPAADEKWREVKFDGQSIVQLNNGLVYTLSTAVVDKKIYLKVQVAFDQSLAAALKADWEREHRERKAKSEADKAEAEKSKDDSQKAQVGADKARAEGDAAGQEAKEKESERVDFPLSSESQSKELQRKYSPWIFELQSFQGEKLRRSKSSLAVTASESSEGRGEEPSVSIKPLQAEEG